MEGKESEKGEGKEQGGSSETYMVDNSLLYCGNSMRNRIIASHS